MNAKEEILRKMIAEKEIPATIYKYASIDTAKLIVENLSLKFSCPFDFNDPFECKANISTNATLDEIIEFMNFCDIRHEFTPQHKRQKAIEAQSHPATFNETIRKSLEGTTRNTRMCCFSGKNDNILMWSHYANMHKGVCLKFDILQDVDFFYPLLPVLYESDFLEYNYVLSPTLVVDKQIRMKAIDWGYEDELRVIKTNGNDYYNFKKESLSEIIFGCSADNKKIDELKGIVEKMKYSHIGFKQAKQVENKYALCITDL